MMWILEHEGVSPLPQPIQIMLMSTNDLLINTIEAFIK